MYALGETIVFIKAVDAAEETLAVARQAHAAPVPLEQRTPEPVLHGADTAADRPVRQAARLGRGGERTVTRHEADGFQIGQRRARATL